MTLRPLLTALLAFFIFGNFTICATAHVKTEDKLETFENKQNLKTRIAIFAAIVLVGKGLMYLFSNKPYVGLAFFGIVLTGIGYYAIKANSEKIIDPETIYLQAASHLKLIDESLLKIIDNNTNLNDLNDQFELYYDNLADNKSSRSEILFNAKENLEKAHQAFIALRNNDINPTLQKTYDDTITALAIGCERINFLVASRVNSDEWKAFPALKEKNTTNRYQENIENLDRIISNLSGLSDRIPVF